MIRRTNTLFDNALHIREPLDLEITSNTMLGALEKWMNRKQQQVIAPSLRAVAPLTFYMLGRIDIQAKKKLYI